MTEEKTNKGTLTLVFPEGTLVDAATSILMRSVRKLAMGNGLDMVVISGSCISPVSISGDFELEKAEELKQNVLVCYKSWEEDR